MVRGWRYGCVLVWRVMVTLLLGSSLAWAAGDLLGSDALAVLEPNQVDAEAPSGVPAARYAVASYLIRYRSTTPGGDETTITAQLFVPQVDGSEALPLYVFGPGTTGLSDECATSQEHQLGVNWGQYRNHLLARAGQGLIAVMPDYMGFHDPDFTQLYFSAVAEGHTMLDAIRATRAFIEGQGGNLRASPGAFVAGYSQGGHAAFAAADLVAEYAPDVELAGVIGYGPTTDMFALFREFTVVAPMVVYAYAGLYGSELFDPSLILAERWLSTLEQDLLSRCVLDIQSYYPSNPRDLFRADFADTLLEGGMQSMFPDIYEIMVANSSGVSGHGIPALIQQGTADTVVTVESQNAFVAALCQGGSPVRYPNYPGTRHDTRRVGFEDTLEWIAARVQGEETLSDCEAFE